MNELTDLYSDILDARRYTNTKIRADGERERSQAAREQKSQGKSATGDSAEVIDKRYKSWTTAFWLLKSFDQFVRNHFALDEPDWSEIDTEDSTINVAAGALLEREYLQAIDILIPQATSATIDETQDAFVLMLTYRFGLRGAEAANLQRQDWIELEEGRFPVLVLVRNNRAHRLKTLASRRQVPLLFRLNA